MQYLRYSSQETSKLLIINFIYVYLSPWLTQTKLLKITVGFPTKPFEQSTAKSGQDPHLRVLPLPGKIIQGRRERGAQCLEVKGTDTDQHDFLATCLDFERSSGLLIVLPFFLMHSLTVNTHREDQSLNYILFLWSFCALFGEEGSGIRYLGSI
ncbi:hypothetical protein L6164_030669 [Bauhinia variegata]|uniref:Uncharacterized protein n=1 Tax=Bauhinia variegata TaxID=167791 RepID=A0ACB9LD23_BAUVA|nr:hypothetical protein L6164_030669 [Bauhinia variegata]